MKKLAFVWALAAGLLMAADSKPKSIAVGDKVPDISLTDLDAKKLTLGELQKRTQQGVVVLSFWCSFCDSCREVEGSFDKLAKEYEGKAVVVALDASAGETAARVRKFAQKNKLSIPIVLDPTGQSADVFGTKVTTTTVVIDGSGTLRYCGRFSDGKLNYAEEALKAVLANQEVKTKTTRHYG